MKNHISFIAVSALAIMMNLSSSGQMVHVDEASVIAKNWIEIIIDRKGSWGNHEQATIQPVKELLKGEKKLGYYCNVQPEGYIILSLRRELAPVKAYSPGGFFEPTSKDKGTEIIMTSLGYILDTIELRLGMIGAVKSSDLLSMLEIDYSGAWDAIYNYTPGVWLKESVEGGSKGNYQEGDILLDGNNWHQHPPFNAWCPYMGCTTTSNGRAYVGCVATAGAQIMYHWSWPPYGVSPYNDTYDWPNMLDVVTNSSPQVVIDAVAELGYEVALAVNMNFGCEGSGASITNMEGVFENYFRYSTACNVISRQNYTAETWFNQIKAQLNSNRPMEYGITGHAIVCDGWQEIASPVVKQYHMNWGWTGTSNDTWYTLDALPGGGYYIEFFLGNIRPVNSLGSTISGTYAPPSFPYRYFDLDASGSSATFNSGQLLQILPGCTIKGNNSSNYVRFYGAAGLHTRIFTRGNTAEGVVIKNGGMRLKNNGTIKLQ